MESLATLRKLNNSFSNIDGGVDYYVVTGACVVLLGERFRAAGLSFGGVKQLVF